MTNLSDFEGLPVTETGAELPGLAGGLRKAFAVEAREDHQGDDVFILIKGNTHKVRFEPVDKDSPDGNQRRVHVYAPETITFVSQRFAAEEIAKQEEAVAEMERQRKAERYADRNQLTIEAAIVALEHEDGDHADGIVQGCPLCFEEQSLADAGE